MHATTRSPLGGRWPLSPTSNVEPLPAGRTYVPQHRDKQLQFKPLSEMWNVMDNIGDWFGWLYLQTPKA
jgi:hypothetical protein